MFRNLITRRGLASITAFVLPAVCLLGTGCAETRISAKKVMEWCEDPPKCITASPAPELAQLDALPGTWEFEAEITAAILDGPLTVTGTVRQSWINGGNALLTETEGRLGKVAANFTGMTYWDSMHKRFRTFMHTDLGNVGVVSTSVGDAKLGCRMCLSTSPDSASLFGLFGTNTLENSQMLRLDDDHAVVTMSIWRASDHTLIAEGKMRLRRVAAADTPTSQPATRPATQPGSAGEAACDLR